MSWQAFGTGVGIELSAERLRVALVKVRPGGVDLLAVCTIEDYAKRSAAEWGNEYLAFLRQHGVAHLTAVVLLPRRDLMVRVVALPGVQPRDFESALTLQIDTLHPYPEGEAAWTFARLGKTASALVLIARQAYVTRLTELFAEAGIKISAFTGSAAAMYGALRLYGAPPSQGFLGLMETEAGVEAYGESPAKPAYSAVYEQSWERASALASAELRLTGETSVRELAGYLPSPRRAPEGAQSYVLAYLAALTAACPRLALPANLLPTAQRSTSSRLIYVPTIALGLLLIAGLAALGLYTRYEDAKYLELVQAETARLEPRAKMVMQLEQRTAAARARMELLDRFAVRTKTDLDALRETTRLIPPPAWLHTLELTRTAMVVGGESEQASGLLKAIDSSALFQNSEFMIPINKVGNVEVFRIRSAREGVTQ